MMLGIDFDRELLICIEESLIAYGNKTMAEANLNCGHPDLSKAASKWCENHGNIINTGDGAHPVNWGTW